MMFDDLLVSLRLRHHRRVREMPPRQPPSRTCRTRSKSCPPFRVSSKETYVLLLPPLPPPSSSSSPY